MFRWLHLSDIHVGMGDQEWLWPNFKHTLYEDFDRLFTKTGPADVLVFSGDIAQQGRAEEYARFNEILAEIRDRLERFGPIPPLVAVPGNHDLSRPDEGGALEAAMRQVPEDTKVLGRVFSAKGDYPGMLAKLFENFTAWQEEAIADGVHLAPTQRGSLAGDMGFTVPFAGGTAGIVTLNSAWLQLAGGDYTNRLHVDQRQLNAAAGGDATAWCNKHSANLIVTHHPSDWLHPASLKVWQNDINPPGRFDLHLYGHMHEHAARSTTYGGSQPRRQIQASSVFGLEFIDGALRRDHGYAIGEIGERYGPRQVSIWPRKLQMLEGGGARLVPDQSQVLDEDNSFSWPFNDRPASPSAPVRPPISMDEASRPDAKAAASIDKLKYHLVASRAHRAVRRVEREEGRAALLGDGMLWISRDWGLGEDAFVWSLLATDREVDHPVFRLDLERYTTREAFLGELSTELGFSFEQLCEFLSTLPSSALILDNVPLGTAQLAGEVPVECQVENLARIVREFASTSTVIMRGRPRTEHVRRALVELKPFEEPDVADYLRAHELGGEVFGKPDVVAKIWQHTGGAPLRLDAMLQDLQVTSLDDLISHETSQPEDMPGVGVPSTLVGTLRDLSGSNVPAWDRAFQLLEALTALPRGEQFERVRRFLGVHPFFPNHARELASRGLIETVQLTGMASDDGGAAARTLVVPRIVLDAVRNQMSPDRRREIDNRALELYFGANWRLGEIEKSPVGKRCSNALCDPYEIVNSCALIEKVLTQAQGEQDSIRLETGVRLASSFAEVLLNGDHFVGAAKLCERVIPLVPIEGNEQRIDILRYALGRSIRMTGRNEEAREIFRKIDRAHLSRDQRRQVDLQMALIHERLDEDSEAAYWAREVLKGGKTDGIGIQAKSILTKQIEDPVKRASELENLEGRARRINASVAANNIALSRASLDPDAEKVEGHLNRVIASAESDRDFFNGAKAIVRLMGRQKRGGNAFADDQITRLIRAYQHLHNERDRKLFDQCHDALWSVFLRNGDRENMLRIFRHSSLIWRLRGEEDRERPFLAAITKFVAEVSNAPGLTRELAYYRARASAALERDDIGALSLKSTRGFVAS